MCRLMVDRSTRFITKVKKKENKKKEKEARL